MSHYDEPGERLGVIPSLLTSALQRGVVPLKTKWDFRLDLRSQRSTSSTSSSASGGSRTFPPPPSASDITLKKLEKAGGAHNASKCLEYGYPIPNTWQDDPGCCAVHAKAKCSGGYQKMKGVVCGSGSWGVAHETNCVATAWSLAAPERKSWKYSNALDTAADLCQELLNQVRTCTCVSLYLCQELLNHQCLCQWTTVRLYVCVMAP